MVFLAAGMLTVAQMAPSPAVSDDPPPTRKTINPNLAPWWELAVLPRIGETSARRIADYRTTARPPGPDGLSSPAFRQAADLTRIHGIGPRTLARVAPYLHFDSE